MSDGSYLPSLHFSHQYGDCAPPIVFTKSGDCKQSTNSSIIYRCIWVSRIGFQTLCISGLRMNSYICTLPAEWRFFKGHVCPFRPRWSWQEGQGISLMLVLLVLDSHFSILSGKQTSLRYKLEFDVQSQRYISIATLLISNIGFFSSNFTPSTCQKYYMAAPILKGMLLLRLQGMPLEL